ncbi:MAG TPA: hypothetical protein VGI64_10585 [Streptosporangiaceae bacterium]
MAQQGPPPRRPAWLPASGQPARSGGRGRPQDWPEQPEQPEHEWSDRPEWPDEPAPDPLTRRPDSRARQDRPRRRGDHSQWESDPFPEDEIESPPWAGPGIYPTGPGRRELRPPRPDTGPIGGRTAQHTGTGGGSRRPGRGRAAAARLRKSRRRVLVSGTTAIVVAVAVAGGLLLFNRHKPAPQSDFITTLQPGEFRSVPNACEAPSAATLSQYLPGSPKKLLSISSPTQSQCSFTLDARPVFRVLQVTSEALQPRVLATGNGSATINAIYSYAQLQAGLAKPAKGSPLSKAQVSQLQGLGQEALSALQVSRKGKIRLEFVTVLIRNRNTLIKVTMEGQASGHGYGPVSASLLRRAGLAVATQALAQVSASPKVPS